MKKRSISLVAILLIGLLSLTGCDPSSKAEASSPVVVGAKDVQTVVADASGLYGTMWYRGLDTLTITKDGKVHHETLFPINDFKEDPYLDEEGKTVVQYQWDGFVEGGYIFVTEKKSLSYERTGAWKGDGTDKIKILGDTTSHQVSFYHITYYGENGLILNDGTAYIRKK